MPDGLLDSGSEFDRCKALLWRWLRDNVKVTNALSGDTLAKYKGHRFVAGWSVELKHKSQLLHFDVLVNAQFPYSAIRVALKSFDAYLKWPHIELGGLLCLPRTPAPYAGVEDAVIRTLTDSLTLIEQCASPEFIIEELRREFISYWNRGVQDEAKRVRSLLDLTNRDTRKIAVWYGQTFTLAGETSDQIRTWLENRGSAKDTDSVPGVFGFLKLAPTMPYPDGTHNLYAMLAEHCPDAVDALDKLPVKHDATVILAAESPTGAGLISMRLSAPKLDGFRKNKNLNAKTKRTLWKTRSRLRRGEVERFDAAWVHGRGINRQQSLLAAATVLVVGCGSLGSQVAVRLAQCGVGSINLIDPENLTTANVGRHALGINSVDKSKATELAKGMRMRFPHMRAVEPHAVTWQTLYSEHPEKFLDADLIVACLGEWSADGQFGEWQTRQQERGPIVYGWLDEFGTAAHAIGVPGKAPALSCVLNSEGELRTPETHWPNGGLVQSEPACGTLFQPYGPIDVVHAEALVSRLCVDILTASVVSPVHRIYAGATAQITAAGGEWSQEHLRYRPKDFDGAFEYERPISACGVCPACTEVT